MIINSMLGPLNVNTLASVETAVRKGLAGANSSRSADEVGSIFGGVVEQIEQGADETSHTTANGDIIYTAKVNGEDQDVAVASSSGTGLTQAGYLNPSAFQQFFNSLQTALEANGLTADTALANPRVTSSSAGDSSATTPGSLTSSLESLEKQLSSGSTSDPTISKLLDSYSTLMGSSGVDISSAGTETVSDSDTRTSLIGFISATLGGGPLGSNSSRSTSSAADGGPLLGGQLLAGAIKELQANFGSSSAQAMVRDAFMAGLSQLSSFSGSQLDETA